MCMLNQTAHMAVRVHVYEHVKLVRVTRVSDMCHTRLPLNLSPVCTVSQNIITINIFYMKPEFKNLKGFLILGNRE